MRNLFLTLELLAIFVALPLLVWLDRFPTVHLKVGDGNLALHKVLPLFGVLAWCLVVLLRDPTFDRSTMSLRRVVGMRGMLVRAAAAAVLLLGVVVAIDPELLFNLPRRKFGLWVLIMVFYPLWSAWPQEVIFRSFFFHRYKGFLSDRWVMILVNSALFAFLHIIFNNWIVLVLTFMAGVLFAWNYARTKSLVTVSIEHAILGNLVFTVGLGQFFYKPPV